MRFILICAAGVAIGIVVSKLSGAAFALAVGAIIVAVGFREGVAGLRRERNGSRSGESARELGEDGQVGMQADPIPATDAKRQ